MYLFIAIVYMNKKAGLLIFSLMYGFAVQSQTLDSSARIGYFSSSVGITNDGISIIPTFTFGKPAVILNMSVGSKKVNIEPEVRMGLNGVPWGAVVWGRYKVIGEGRMNLNVGVNGALNFATGSFSDDQQKAIFEAQRYVGLEISPNYWLTKNTSVGLYYLHGHGFESDAPRNVDFLTVNANFSNIRLTRQYFLQFLPQLYYLKQDNEDGFYFTSTLAFVRKNFPLSIQSTINETIKSNISGNQTFSWNITLIWSVNKVYAEIKQSPF